jgi:dolichol-phosphate mannosyltransferase
MQEGYDCVFGSRFCPGGAMMNSSWRRYALSYGGTLLANTLLGTSLTDMTSGFQLFQRQALQAVLRSGIRSHGPFFQTEMKAHCRQMNVTEVPIQYQSPTHAVGSAALGDALLNLGRLLWARVAGRL